MNLVTGATGLLGSYLTKLLLQKGEAVRAIRRKSSDLSLLGEYAQQVQWVEADLLDIIALEEAMNGIERVYHCAAHISFMPSEVDMMMKINVEGTANVMNAALVSGVKKMLHVSSVAAFGLPAQGKVIDEQYTDPNINSCFWYYKSKHYGEREAWRAHAEGLPLVVANPGTIIGAGWWDDEPNSLFREIDNGLKFYTNAQNGFIDVRDAALCLYQLMNSSIDGERFLLVAENRSFKEIMWLIADALHVKRPGIEAGTWLREVAWRAEAIKSFFTGSRPLITKESAGIASIPFTYNNAKIKKALGIPFRSMEESIADTAKAYLESKQQGKDYGTFQQPF